MFAKILEFYKCCGLCWAIKVFSTIIIIVVLLRLKSILRQFWEKLATKEGWKVYRYSFVINLIAGIRRIYTNCQSEPLKRWQLFEVLSFFICTFISYAITYKLEVYLSEHYLDLRHFWYNLLNIGINMVVGTAINYLSIGGLSILLLKKYDKQQYTVECRQHNLVYEYMFKDISCLGVLASLALQLKKKGCRCWCCCCCCCFCPKQVMINQKTISEVKEDTNYGCDALVNLISFLISLFVASLFFHCFLNPLLPTFEVDLRMEDELTVATIPIWKYWIRGITAQAGPIVTSCCNTANEAVPLMQDGSTNDETSSV